MVIKWGAEKGKTIEQQFLSVPDNLPIKTIACGFNFCILLAKSGLLFGLGDNDVGQLGLNDQQPRDEPQLISYLKI